MLPLNPQSTPAIDAMKAHPAADLFPMLTGTDLAELAEDIKQHGLIEPIWLYDNPEHGRVILDGRNRLAACKLAGVEPRTRVYTGADPIRFSLSLNEKRRHLNQGQRAMLALEVEKMYAREAKSRHAEAVAESNRKRAEEKPSVANVPPMEPLPAMAPIAPKIAERKEVAAKSREQAAQAVGASGRAVQQAKRVAKVAPDLAEKVKAGKVSLGNADKIVQRREAARKQEEAIVQAQELPPVADLRVGDFRSVLTDLAGKVDAIITDPPYPHEFIPLLSDLSRIAAQVLKPGGICAVMMGQNYLPEVYARLSEHLDYHWTFAYLTPGGQSVQVWPKKVNTFWKPIITLTNGPLEVDRWMGDVAKSEVNNNDKRFHHWGQSESGMADLVKRLTVPGQTVLDPFMGAGTTGVVALALGREFIGCDLDASMVAKADARTKAVTR